MIPGAFIVLGCPACWKARVLCEACIVVEDGQFEPVVMVSGAALEAAVADGHGDHIIRSGIRVMPWHLVTGEVP